MECNLTTQIIGYGSKAPYKHRHRPCDRQYSGIQTQTQTLGYVSKMQDTWTQTLGYGSRDAQKHGHRLLDTVVTIRIEIDTDPRIRQQKCVKHKHEPQNTPIKQQTSIDTDPGIQQQTCTEAQTQTLGHSVTMHTNIDTDSRIWQQKCIHTQTQTPDALVQDVYKHSLSQTGPRIC